MNRKGEFSAISMLLFGIPCAAYPQYASAQSPERLDLAENSPFLYLAVNYCRQTGEVSE